MVIYSLVAAARQYAELTEILGASLLTIIGLAVAFPVTTERRVRADRDHLILQSLALVLVCFFAAHTMLETGSVVIPAMPEGRAYIDPAIMHSVNASEAALLQLFRLASGIVYLAAIGFLDAMTWLVTLSFDQTHKEESVALLIPKSSYLQSANELRQYSTAEIDGDIALIQTSLTARMLRKCLWGAKATLLVFGGFLTFSIVHEDYFSTEPGHIVPAFSEVHSVSTAFGICVTFLVIALIFRKYRIGGRALNALIASPLILAVCAFILYALYFLQSFSILPSRSYGYESFLFLTFGWTASVASLLPNTK